LAATEVVDPVSDQPDSRRPAVAEAQEELAECPFCASTNIALYEYAYAQEFAVICNLCGGQGPRRASPREAGKLWNRRVHI
jgi:hypothetical protein